MGDPVAGLVAAVHAVRSVRPDAVLVTGDLVDNATDAEYERVRELLEPLRVPTYVLPGNHDDRAAIRRHFELPGAGADPVQYSADFGAELRLVVLDSLAPGEDSGSLDRERLGWLDSELASAPDAPTLIAMHHPPVLTGLAPWDAIGLPDADRHALGEVIGAHPQVRRIVAGHVHHTFTGELAGCPTLTIPSTFLRRPRGARRRIGLAPGAGGLALALAGHCRASEPFALSRMVTSGVRAPGSSAGPCR